MWQSMHVALLATPATRGAPRGCGGFVATLADRDVTLYGFGTARDIVRVVTRQAGHLAALKARRLAQAVRAAGDLELVVAPRRSGCVIEMDEVIAQRLPRRVRKRRMLVSRNLKRQRRARGLEVTLHARFELALTIEFRGVHNRSQARFDVAGFHCIDVGLSRSVTPLAVDALGQRLGNFGPSSHPRTALAGLPRRSSAENERAKAGSRCGRTCSPHR